MNETEKPLKYQKKTIQSLFMVFFWFAQTSYNGNNNNDLSGFFYQAVTF